MRRVGLFVVLGLLVAACSTDPRATRLELHTSNVQLLPEGCPAAVAAPFRIERDGDAVAFMDAGTDEPVQVTWPFGFAAWLEFGQAVLYASDGEVVGREGDVLDNIGGAGDDHGFRVCAIGVRTYQ